MNGPKLFHMRADAILEADNLEDAFQKLSDYFYQLAKDDPTADLFISPSEFTLEAKVIN